MKLLTDASTPHIPPKSKDTVLTILTFNWLTGSAEKILVTKIRYVVINNALFSICNKLRCNSRGQTERRSRRGKVRSMSRCNEMIRTKRWQSFI